MTAFFDEEVSRASVSVLALGYIHDIVARHEALSEKIEQIQLEVNALERDRPLPAALKNYVFQADDELTAVEALIQQMRKVAAAMHKSRKNKRGVTRAKSFPS